MSDQTTSGHGHVTPRRDGAKARCGGPAICPSCQEEQRQMDAVHANRQAEAPAPLSPERLAEIRAHVMRSEYNRDHHAELPSSPGNMVRDLLDEIDRLTDDSEPDTESTEGLMAGWAAHWQKQATRLQEALARIDGHPTPVDDHGRCWYCSGGLGHGPNGHKGDCPLVAIRKAASPGPPPTTDGSVQRPFGEHLVTTRRTADGYLAACTCFWTYENTSPSIVINALGQHAAAAMGEAGRHDQTAAERDAALARINAMTAENPTCLGHVPANPNAPLSEQRCGRCGQPEPCEVRRMWIMQGEILEALNNLYFAVVQVTNADPTHYEVANTVGQPSLIALQLLQRYRANGATPP